LTLQHSRTSHECLSHARRHTLTSTSSPCKSGRRRWACGTCGCASTTWTPSTSASGCQTSSPRCTRRSSRLALASSTSTALQVCLACHHRTLPHLRAPSAQQVSCLLWPASATSHLAATVKIAAMGLPAVNIHVPVLGGLARPDRTIHIFWGYFA